MLGSTLAHYEILEKLGEGGMGVVYKARDPRLKRFVALKVLPPEVAADEGRKARLLREARAASALSHPHIVVVHDIVHEGERDFIVMEYVEGKALSELIPKGGLPATEAVAYAEQIADALHAAHAADMVHRDLKPGNVMVDQRGRVKVLDFGLAKHVEEDAADVEALTRSRPLTQDGLVMGTLSYMAPEQATGESIDQRADIFSFGILLYEMLTGVRPFRGRNQAVLLHELLYAAPRPLREVAPGAPEALARLVHRALEKRPGDRPESMGEIVRELQALRTREGIGPGSGAVSGGPSAPPANLRSGSAPKRRRSGATRRRRAGPPRPGAERASLAVLPFASLSPDPDDLHLAIGIATEIIGALSGVPDLRVASRLASFRFQEPIPDLKKVAKQLDIRYVLTGSMRRAGNRIRVIAELTDAVPGTQLWAKTYERELADIFQVQEEIALAIVSATGGQLIRADAERAGHRAPESLDAWGLLHKAYLFWNRGFSREGVDEALALLRRAVSIDPYYAAAHAALGMYLVQRVANAAADRPQDEKAEALRAVERALELAPRDPTVLEYAGVVLYHHGLHERSVQVERLCVEVAPFNLVGWGYLAMCLGWAGDAAEVEEAQEILDRLFEQAPDHPSVPYWYFFRAAACARQGRYEESLEAARRSIELNPGYYIARGPHANALGRLGRVEEARESWRLGQAINPAFTPEFYRALARDVMVREERAQPHLGGLMAAGLLPEEGG
jgi:serine/threonine protein kinase/tetratricopeptide (TPR) repeat protein